VRHAVICLRGLLGDFIRLGGVLRPFIERGDEVHVFTRKDFTPVTILQHIKGLSSYHLLTDIPIDINSIGQCDFPVNLQRVPWLYMLGLLRIEHAVNVSHLIGNDGVNHESVVVSPQEYLASSLGVQYNDINVVDWVVFPAEELMAKVWLRQNAQGDGPLVVLQVHSTSVQRRLPVDTAIALYDALVKRGYRVVVAYFPKDTADYTGFVIRRAKTLGGLPWGVSCAVLKQASLCISVDTAILHMAAAFGLPTVGLFGPTNGDVIMRHYPTAVNAELPVSIPCRNCYYRSSFGASEECAKAGCTVMGAHTVESILTAVDSCLGARSDASSDVAVSVGSLSAASRQKVLGNG